MSKRLFVGNLPYSIAEPQLKELFSQAGNVESVTIIIDRETGQGKGFAFVEMVTDEEAQKAIEMFKDHKMGDRALVVNEARPREERDGRSPNRGDRGGRSSRTGFRYR